MDPRQRDVVVCRALYPPAPLRVAVVRAVAFVEGLKRVVDLGTHTCHAGRGGVHARLGRLQDTRSPIGAHGAGRQQRDALPVTYACTGRDIVGIR